MFFYASKIVWALIAPSNLLVLLIAIGLLISLWRRRLGMAVALLGLAGLVIFGLTPASQVPITTLENRFPPFVDDGRPVDGVIVLGGAEQPNLTAARGQPSFSDGAERIMALADLSRRYPQARVLFSGGSNAILEAPAMSESESVRRALPQFGVAPERVLFEGRSRNTIENARLSKELLQPKPGERWLLVTSAFHMPRAMGCFRAEGFDVTAYPVDYRTEGAGWHGYRAIADGLSDLDTGVKEWVGLVTYYLTGRIGALLPGP